MTHTILIQYFVLMIKHNIPVENFGREIAGHPRQGLTFR